MKTTTALIIEPSDWTKDGNLKKEVFFAMGDHSIVISEGKIIKGGAVEAPQKLQEPVKRVKREQVPQPAPEPAQAIVELSSTHINDEP